MSSVTKEAVIQRTARHPILDTVHPQSIPQERQTNLWSATVPPWVQQLALKYCDVKRLEKVDMVGDSTVRTAGMRLTLHLA